MRKTTFSGFLATFILCYAFWIALTWSLDGQELVAGAIVSAVGALFGSRFFIHEKAFWLAIPKRLVAMIGFVFVFLWELIKTNCSMAKLCLFGDVKNVNAGIVRVPVNLKKFYAKAMLANAITNTPGTITMDIATEMDEEDQPGQTYYYIHWINVETRDENEAGEKIKGRMENSLRRVWE